MRLHIVMPVSIYLDGISHHAGLSWVIAAAVSDACTCDLLAVVLRADFQ